MSPLWVRPAADTCPARIKVRPCGGVGNLAGCRQGSGGCPLTVGEEGGEG